MNKYRDDDAIRDQLAYEKAQLKDTEPVNPGAERRLPLTEADARYFLARLAPRTLETGNRRKRFLLERLEKPRMHSTASLTYDRRELQFIEIGLLCIDFVVAFLERGHSIGEVLANETAEAINDV